MARRDGSWLLKLEVDGQLVEQSTDSLTLDELDTVEQVSGIPWAAQNPLRSARCAKALLAVLLIRAGRTEDVAVKTAGAVTMDQLSEAFTFVPPVDPLPATGSPTPRPRRLRHRLADVGRRALRLATGRDATAAAG